MVRFVGGSNPLAPTMKNMVSFLWVLLELTDQLLSFPQVVLFPYSLKPVALSTRLGIRLRVTHALLFSQ